MKMVNYPILKPMSFSDDWANKHIRELKDINWRCEEMNCGWYSPHHKRCSILLLACEIRKSRIIKRR